MYKGPYLLPSGIFKRMCHRDGLSDECRFIWIRKGGYSRCVFMVHRGCWIIEQKNSLWSMLCSPHTNLLPVSLPESHSFFKCLQGGCCGILFFPTARNFQSLSGSKLICSRHVLSRIQRTVSVISDLIASSYRKVVRLKKNSWTLIPGFLSFRKTLILNAGSSCTESYQEYVLLPNQYTESQCPELRISSMFLAAV